MHTQTKQQRTNQPVRTRHAKAGPRRKRQPGPTEPQRQMLALVFEAGRCEYRPQAATKGTAVLVMPDGQIRRLRRPTLAELVQRGWIVAERYEAGRFVLRVSELGIAQLGGSAARPSAIEWAPAQQ